MLSRNTHTHCVQSVVYIYLFLSICHIRTSYRRFLFEEVQLDHTYLLTEHTQYSVANYSLFDLAVKVYAYGAQCCSLLPA